jgi:hypothetical protein
MPRGPVLDAALVRFEVVLEQVDGLFKEMERELKRRIDLDLGPVTELDQLFGAWSPAAHRNEDLFRSRIAFVALLNFPLTTLEERLARGPGWSRREWVEARLADRFYRRVPGDVLQQLAEADARAELYIAEYNIYLHHVVDQMDLPPAKRPFPRGLRLLTHWNLRDEIKARYAQQGGIRQQRLIAKVMERIVDQTIPQAVINSPRLDWNPATNEVRPAKADTVEDPGAKPAVATGEREPDTRYARLLDFYRAARLSDPYSPSLPTLIARRFERDRELPEARVRAMLEQVLSSPAADAPAGERTRRPGPQALSDGCRLPEGSSASARQARFRPRQGAVPRGAHSSRRGAWFRTRHGVLSPRGQATSAHAHRLVGDGLQGFQHRHPRARPQR